MTSIRPTELHALSLIRHPDLPGTLLLDSRFERHATVPHASREWCVMLCPQGLEHFETLDYSGPLPPGSFVLLAPERIRSDRAGWDQPCRVLVAYLPELPLSPDIASLQRPEAGKLFLDWFEAVAAGANITSLNHLQSHWLSALEPVTRLPEALPAAGTGRSDWLDWRHVPALDQLTRQSRRSKTAVLRSFRRHWGCTPDQYRRQLQLRAAAQLLQQGLPVAQAALEAGFWDQSHLHRHFITVYGVTPGEFCTRNSVQDASLNLM